LVLGLEKPQAFQSILIHVERKDERGVVGARCGSAKVR